MDFRQYDPSTGRFYTIDLLAEATYSVTPYHFAGNNPVIGSDPTGLLTFFNGMDHSQPKGIQGSFNGYGMINRFGNTEDSFLDNLHSGYGLDPSGGGAFPGSTPYGLGTGYSGGYQGHLDYAEGGHWLYVGKQNTVTITGYNTMNNGVPGYYADIKVDNRDYHVWQPTKRKGPDDGGLGNWFSGFDVIAGAYSEYGHNHTTYRTTQGIEMNIYYQNGQIRSARAARFARLSNFVRGVAVVGSVVSTGYSAYKVVNQYNAGGIQNVDRWDATDAGVGIIGLGATGLAYFSLISNPLGWAIGAGVLIYSGARLAYDLSND